MIKPGYRTSEFYFTLVLNVILVLQFIQENLVHDTKTASVIAFALVVLNGAYSLARGLAKSVIPALTQG